MARLSRNDIQLHSTSPQKKIPTQNQLVMGQQNRCSQNVPTRMKNFKLPPLIYKTVLNKWDRIYNIKKKTHKIIFSSLATPVLQPIRKKHSNNY